MGRNDLQTEADRSAQRCIIASLSQQFPDVTIIGEEGPSDPSDEVCHATEYYTYLQRKYK